MLSCFTLLIKLSIYIYFFKFINNVFHPSKQLYLNIIINVDICKNIISTFYSWRKKLADFLSIFHFVLFAEQQIMTIKTF